jgi:hypothetical protein
MIEIAPEDLSQLNAFPLRWRWTDKRYTVLSADQLARIQPLRPQRAQEVHQVALKSLSAESGDFDIDSRIFESAARIDSRSPDVVAWLTDRLPSRTPVVVSWDRSTAVLTDSELFVEHWKDFCYASSDDVSLLPLDVSWVLHFGHEEQLLHARRRACA